VKLWTKIAVGAVAVLVIGAAAWWGGASREPVYRGRGVREWIEGGDWKRGQWVSFRDSEEAFKHFGTNTIPYVRAGLRASDTWDRRMLLWLKLRAPWSGIRIRFAVAEHAVALAAYSQILNGDDWGEARAACEPELRALMNDSDLWTRMAVTNALAYIDSKKEN
jgi:hypothetical protein